MYCPSEHPNHRLKLMGKKTLFIMVHTYQLSLLNETANIYKYMILALMLHCPSNCFAFRFGKAVPPDINFAVFIVLSTHILLGLIFIRPLPVLLFAQLSAIHMQSLLLYTEVLGWAVVSRRLH